MYKINLIKGWKKVLFYKKIRSQVSAIFIFIFVLMILSYVSLFIYLITLQNKLTSLSGNQLNSNAINRFPSETVSKTIYGMQKLDEIRNIDETYPDYYKIHKFLIAKILKQKSFTIQQYSLEKNHSVDISLITTNLSDIFTFLSNLESKEVIKSFQIIEVETIALENKGEDSQETFSLELKLQFNPDFANG